MVAKRAILRLRESDFPNLSSSDLVACVQSFVAFSGRPVEELAQGKLYWHVQPPSPDILQGNPRFHIIIDVHKMEHSGPLPQDFPHEIYRVSKVENEMRVKLPLGLKISHSYYSS